MRQTFVNTLRSVLQDQGALLLLVIAPVLYSFFYPWPYLTQVVQRVPVAVVDQDHSNLSRQITRFVDASPKLRLQVLTSDEGQAQRALKARQIEGYVVLPKDLKRDVLRGAPVTIPVSGDGAYFLINKTALGGLAEAVGTMSAGVEIAQSRARGQSGLQALASRIPVNIQPIALFNPSEGYGSYVVPAVAVLIVQQLLLIGTALWVGTWFETRRTREPARQWLARIAVFVMLGLASCAYFFGFVFAQFDYARAGNPWGAAALLLPFCWATAALGAALGALFADRERSMQVLLATSLPIAFLGGFSWPLEALPAPLRALGQCIPAVPGMQGFLRLNQMGASWADVMPQAVALSLQALVYSALALALARWRSNNVNVNSR